ncbi:MULTISPECIES: DnaD domain protein [Virgibacillus]
MQKELDNWCEKISEEIVLEAIMIAVKKGGRTFSYAEKNS